MLVKFFFLLRKSGVLERLIAAGVTVAAPKQ